MSARYDLEPLPNSAGYKFITSSGDIYVAYFTEFILLDPSEQDVFVVSFGFTCKRAEEETRHYYDNKVKHTIIYIIKEFFNEQPENAVLYICMHNDRRGRNRHIIFNAWYNEFNAGIEKYNSADAHGKLGFYGSILFKEDNPNKQKLINSFYFTLDYWGLNDE